MSAPAGQPLRLVLASNNAKKLAELQALLAGLPLAITPQGELGIAEADEPHHTFIENALAKARAASRASGCAAIADDSGLCVNALGGAPGVVSAHYAGEVAVLAAGPGQAGGAQAEDREARRRRQDAANNAALLAALAALPGGEQTDGQTSDGQTSDGQHPAARRAHFVSTLVALRHADDPEPLVAVGRWAGQILTAPRGAMGFGYDPLMWIPELGASVAELPPELKNQHSHRARSAALMRRMLADAWGLCAA